MPFSSNRDGGTVNMKKAWLLVLAMSAQTAFGQAQTAPAHPQASSQRGQIYFLYSNAKLYEAQGLYTQGIAELKKALELEPGSSFLLSAVANMYYGNRRATEAAEYAEKAVKADPDNPDPHELLSRIYFDIYGGAVRRGTPQERAAALARTILEFEELVRINPSNQQAALNLGRLYREQKGVIGFNSLGQIGQMVDGVTDAFLSAVLTIRLP
jgi:tetratricopeptide (TPR) repeat protein